MSKEWTELTDEQKVMRYELHYVAAELLPLIELVEQVTERANTMLEKLKVLETTVMEGESQ